MPLCFSETQACCGAGTGPLSRASVETDEPKSQAHVLSPALLLRLRQVSPAASPESGSTKHPPGWGWGEGSQGCDNSGTLTSASTSQAAAVSGIEGFKGSSLSLKEDGHRGGLQSTGVVEPASMQWWPLSALSTSSRFWNHSHKNSSPALCSAHLSQTTSLSTLAPSQPKAAESTL